MAEKTAERPSASIAAPTAIPAGPAGVLALQNSAGNAATARLVGSALQREQAGAQRPQQAPVQPAGPREQREFVRLAIDYLESGRSYFELARVDQAMLDRVLAGWRTMVTQCEAIAASLSDDRLRDDLRAAYRGALRTLLARASTQVGRPAVRLYLENVHVIPDWALPNAAMFQVATEAERRAFVQDATGALNALALGSGFPQITEAVLIDLLTRLRTLVDDQHQIIADQLGNDLALRDGLRAAYVHAVQDLLVRAAAVTGTNAELLYLRFRYGTPAPIPEWADQQVAGITTPLPPGLTADAQGNVTMTISGVRVIFLPDGTKQSAGAATNLSFNFHNAVNWQTRGGVVTSHTGPGTPEARIRTRYGPNLTSASRSGYGRGTTAADIAAGTTTLGFHEGSHGRDYLRFLVNHPFPTFTGRDGMATADFQQAVQDYAAACSQYNRDIERFSEEQTDCVGITIEDYYRGRGQQSPVVCP